MGRQAIGILAHADTIGRDQRQGEQRWYCGSSSVDGLVSGLTRIPDGRERLAVQPYSGVPLLIFRSGPGAMYGEAILRASFHAGWPTLGGVPGRLTFDSSNALDLAKTNRVQKICRLYNPEHIFNRLHHQTFWGVGIFHGAVPETRNAPSDGATVAQQCSSLMDDCRSSKSPQTMTSQA